MTVGVLIVTHRDVGDALLKTAANTLGFCPLATSLLGVEDDSEPDKLHRKALGLLTLLDSGEGVLVLIDMYGLTPSNIACKLLSSEHQVRVISGLNLPMLIRIFNYSNLTLDEIMHKALSGGREGVMDCSVEVDRL